MSGQSFFSAACRLRRTGLLLALLALAAQLALLRPQPPAAPLAAWCGGDSVSTPRTADTGLPAVRPNDAAIPFEAGSPPLPPDAAHPPGPAAGPPAILGAAARVPAARRAARLRPPARAPPAAA